MKDASHRTTNRPSTALMAATAIFLLSRAVEGFVARASLNPSAIRPVMVVSGPASTRASMLGGDAARTSKSDLAQQSQKISEAMRHRYRGGSAISLVSSRINQADSPHNYKVDPTAMRMSAASQAEGHRATKGSSQRVLSLGAPRHRPDVGDYVTQGDVKVSCKVMDVDDTEERVAEVVSALDSRRGILLSSSYEFPDRYARWTLGFCDPPIEISGSGRNFRVQALNGRGRVLLPAFWRALSENCAEVQDLKLHGSHIEGRVKQAEGYFKEEERSRQPTLFSVVRRAVDLFHSDADPQLGLYGAFGYDLTYQFDSIPLKHERDGSQRDLVLYLPDRVLVIDKDKRDAWSIEYDFEYGGVSTVGMPRHGAVTPYVPSGARASRDTLPGDYSRKVERAKEEFKVGNLFEVVLSQTFKEPCSSSPSEVFRRLQRRNPSPYGFLINLGEQEYLVGASPEMFVRCERTGQGIRVETCPISGTIERGANPLEDAQRIRSLLMSQKEESELTMCTDVDRNDKSRICRPSSVRVLGRRQIEMYSRLIHTVDHVEGYLRKGFDALDAFLCHTWAVTVTGAPKNWAIRFVEQNEDSPRAWYGGAVGVVGFDGHLNTGLTLRTVRVKDGIAEVRAGATLLFDSEPEMEEAETELKASAMIDAVIRSDPPPGSSGSEEAFRNSISTGAGKAILLVDHEDSFVHTLGNYLRQTGAEVNTVRSGDALAAYLRGVRKGKQPHPDLVVLSPGPGNPGDFGLSDTIVQMLELKIPVFGVCLGLQGMVEHFGGELAVLSYPMHGKSSMVSIVNRESHSRKIFEGIPDSFEVARYHSLHGPENKLPDVLRPTATTSDGVVMALEHKELPFAAVQFHPESILTNPKTGLTILANCLRYLRYEEGGE